MRPRDAIILAAGQGARLRGVVDDRPKGLIEIDGESLVGRSVRLLRAAGIGRITIVAGYRLEQYQSFAAGAPDVRIVINDQYATTGSMASLALALEDPGGDVLVLESDIVYEARALTLILQSEADDATLISGETGAGDEVWVSAPQGRLAAMSKTRSELASVEGEFVGITRLSSPAGALMRRAFDRFLARHGHGRMDYETGGLVDVARVSPIATLLVPDLCWGEIDDERHLARVVDCVWPRVQLK